jgi:hypothetical protein
MEQKQLPPEMEALVGTLTALYQEIFSQYPLIPGASAVLNEMIQRALLLGEDYTRTAEGIFILLSNEHMELVRTAIAQALAVRKTQIQQ